jgi:hypothetical protein
MYWHINKTAMKIVIGGIVEDFLQTPAKLFSQHPVKLFS